MKGRQKRKHGGKMHGFLTKAEAAAFQSDARYAGKGIVQSAWQRAIANKGK